MIVTAHVGEVKGDPAPLPPASSPSHLLPIDVYCGDHPLTDVTRLLEKVYSHCAVLKCTPSYKNLFPGA